MILALLLAQASAVEAERAFAADAQAQGQWTAFRKWATEDAVMFWPQPVKAQEQLKTLPDPPRSVEWRPARSFVSCDGTMAANTGPWRNANGGIGYFSTIWVKQPAGGWKWTVDGGDAVTQPKFAWDAEPVVRRASCAGRPFNAMITEPPPEGGEYRFGRSADGTILHYWAVARDGAREFKVQLWNGDKYDTVIHDRIAAPPPKP